MNKLITILAATLAFGNMAMAADYLPLAQQAIAESGSNSAELQKALEQVPVEQRNGIAFLIAHMPQSDLNSLKADFLIENVKWAYKARETYPWAKEVPEDVFLNDVLPYASLNERRDNWRKDFYQRFSKHVTEKQTMLEALEAVNKAVKDEVKVDYNTKRKKPDQSPYESMEINMASCTGLSILLTDAFRAVGIPARVAGTPAWTTKHGNHNWVEVWTGEEKQWQFTEYYPDVKGLDHGWLLADAAQANPKSLYHSIYASSWKPADSHFPLVWNLENKDVHAVNVSDYYIQLGKPDKESSETLCELRLEFLDAQGNRISVPATVLQGDAEIDKGNTPKPTDDMNRYLTISVKRGQIYTIAWEPPGSKKPQYKQVKTGAKDAWLVQTLTATKQP